MYGDAFCHVQELTLTWPQRVQDMPARQELAMRLDEVLQRTGMHTLQGSPVSPELNVRFSGARHSSEATMHSWVNHLQ